MKKLWLDLGNTRLKYWIVDNDTIIAHDAKEHLKAPNELLFGLLGTLASFSLNLWGFLAYLAIKLTPPLTRPCKALPCRLNLPKSMPITPF
ncbi:hypothetical protein LP128_02395 [Moraxella bovis]|nr:hypothetical protein [Moraxella bovis]UZA46003.1 hypothetical protein LP128_02395 [Moraxella bovis]